MACGAVFFVDTVVDGRLELREGSAARHGTRGYSFRAFLVERSDLPGTLLNRVFLASTGRATPGLFLAMK